MTLETAVERSFTRSPAPRLARHAALLVFADMSPLRPRALPGTPITALTSAFNCRFQVQLLFPG